MREFLDNSASAGASTVRDAVERYVDEIVSSGQAAEWDREAVARADADDEAELFDRAAAIRGLLQEIKNGAGLDPGDRCGE
jgi:hypothetical protein